VQSGAVFLASALALILKKISYLTFVTLPCHPVAHHIECLMTERQKTELPQWACGPVDQFLESARRSNDFYHLTVHGLRVIIHYDNRVDVLTAELEKYDNEDGLGTRERNSEDESRKAASKIAEQAKKEVNEGFPILHQQQIVSCWGSLESLIEDLLVAFLANEPTVMKCEQVRRIKVGLSDFGAMSEVERSYYLISELQRDLRPPRKHGIDKFEGLRDIFGLSGTLDCNVRRELIEIENIRNVLLHRRGIADKKLLEMCPWLTLSVGDRVPMDEASLTRYTGAVFDYVELLIDRIKSYYSAQHAAL
jgi:hypothetical protein